MGKLNTLPVDARGKISNCKISHLNRKKKLNYQQLSHTVMISSLYKNQIKQSAHHR